MIRSQERESVTDRRIERPAAREERHRSNRRIGSEDGVDDDRRRMRSDDEGQARVDDHSAADPAGVSPPGRHGRTCDPIEESSVAFAPGQAHCCTALPAEALLRAAITLSKVQIVGEVPWPLPVGCERAQASLIV